MSTPDGFAPEPHAPEQETPGQDAAPERSVAALLADLAADLRTLLRLEIALFRIELEEKARRVGRGIVALAAGGVLAASAWLVLLAAAVLGLARVLDAWLAAFVVAAATLFAGALLLWLGKRWLAAKGLVPRRSLGALRQDRAWIKERVS
jgi:hypothetical protein